MSVRKVPQPRFFSRPRPVCMCAMLGRLPNDSSIPRFRPRGARNGRKRPCDRARRLVRGLREVVDHIYQGPDMIDGGLGKNSMTEVEYVTGPVAGLLENAPSLPLDFR